MPEPTCRHAPHIVPWPAGTWVDEKVGGRVRVVCSVCGRFYGWRASDKESKKK